MSLNLASNSLTMNGILEGGTVNLDDMFVSGISSIANLTINEDLSIGGSLATGSNIVLGKNIVVSGTSYLQTINASSINVTNDCNITGNIIFKNQIQGYIYISNQSIPLITSISNTLTTYTNLDIQTVLGTTGNSTPILILPNVRVLFLGINDIKLYDFTNTTSLPIYNLITFTSSVVCLKIQIISNGILL